MGTSWGQIAKEESKTNPGILEYTRCQSTAFVYSMLMLVATSGVTFGIVKNKRFNAVPMQHRILFSLLSGSFGAWYLARVRTQYCQDLWLALDEQAKRAKKQI